ncbi:MAG: MBL fold metallo-hydrolase [Spirochaetaceae bacterium]|nr:MAG: MBL fold metallo-hydrolase [Spirochaetaceae bacterium]
MRFYSYFSVLNFSNCYLIGPDGPGDAVLVDAGVFDERLLKLIEDNGLYVRWVLITHLHHGHIHGLPTLRKIYEAGIYAFDPERLEAPLLGVGEGKPLECGPFSFQVLETPGHSNDSVCFLLNEMLFTGDTLSAGSIGRTATGYERALLLSSIRKKLLSLKEDVLIFPGHGPPTRLEIERRFNPYLEQKL